MAPPARFEPSTPPSTGPGPPGASPTRSGGERRFVTAIYADLAGFTAFSERRGEEESYRLMQRISLTLSTIVGEHGGTINSFTGDGVLALFGAPVAAEDDALRACRAAVAVQRKLSDDLASYEREHGLRPQLRIAISTGPVVFGEVHGRSDLGATALGDTVNLAARLERRATPGSIVLSESTKALVDGLVECEPIGEYSLKGKREIKRIYRLIAIRQGATRFATVLSRGLLDFVGRAQELDALEGALRTLGTQVVTVDVSGEPGIGKSRLLHEFALRARALGAQVLQGTCSPTGRQTSLLLFREVVLEALGIQSGATESEIETRLEERLRSLGIESNDAPGLVARIVGVAFGSGLRPAVDTAFVGIRTRELILEVIRRRSRQTPVVLVLEDLQWVDSASEELLGRIVESADPGSLLVVHTHRPEYHPPWSATAHLTTLALPRLSNAEILRMVGAQLGTEDLPKTLGQLVTEKSDGNPLFAEEITRLIEERGIVRHEETGVTFEERRAVALPSTILAIVAARVDRLTAADRDMLQVAAVIGRRFDSRVLRTAAGGEGDAGARLEALQVADLVFRDSTSTSWSFKHALVRDALYESILRSERGALHLRVAGAIEQERGEPSPEIAEELANHYAQTTHADRTFRYLAIAGRRNLDLYALDPAERCFDRALRLLGSSPDAADDRALGKVVLDNLEAVYLRNDFVEVVRLAEEFLPRLERLGDASLLSLALFFLCNALVNRGDPKAALPVGLRALDLADRARDVMAMARAREALLFIHASLGDSPLVAAEAMGREAVAQATEVGVADQYNLNWTFWAVSWDYLNRGLMVRAREWADRLVDSGRSRNDRRALGLANWTLAWVEIIEGRYDDSVRHARETVASSTTPFDRCIGEAAEGTALVLGGEAELGLAKIRSVRKLTRESGWRQVETAIDLAESVGLALTGHLRKGMRLLRQAIQERDRQGLRTIAAWSRITLAEMYIEVLTSKNSPGARFILQNLGAIIGARIAGDRTARSLLLEALGHEQLAADGAIVARIKMDLGILDARRREYARAREWFVAARTGAERQGSTNMLHRIESCLSDLPRPPTA